MPINAEEIRAELLATRKDIRILCKLAGKPELAEGFIDEDLSVSDVLAKLEPRTLDPAAIFNKWNSA